MRTDPGTHSRARQLLDLLFGSIWSRLIPVLTAAAMNLLFVLFGESEEKTVLLAAAPAVSLIGFGGAFLVLFVQVKNPICPPRFLDMMMLLFTTVFGCSAIALLIQFLRDIRHGFTFSLPLTLFIWSAISLAHSRRRD